MPIYSEASPATKRIARNVYGRAVKEGSVKRPDFCFRCGGDGDGKTIEGHHVDYRAPLVVVWLCQPCHKREHGTDARKRRPREHGPTIEPGFVSPADAARILNASRNEVRSLAASGVLAEYRITTNTIRYRLSDIRALAEGN